MDFERCIFLSGPMRKCSEIVSIGDELLSGSTLDTNAHWLTQELTALNIPVIRRHTISDDEEEIIHILESLSAQSKIVIFTGGLGPTRDDITKKTITEYLGGKLIFSEDMYREIHEKLKHRRGIIPESNREQALIPDNGKILPNPIGSAAGLLFHHQDRQIYLIPGVPEEMKRIFLESIRPGLLKSPGEKIQVLVFRTTGIMESEIVDMIDEDLSAFDNVKAGYYPSVYGVNLKMTVKESDIESTLPRLRDFLYHRLGDFIYAEGETDITEVVIDRLKRKKWTLALAESCTGGLISHRMTEIPGVSDVFSEGFVTYSNESKIRLLGVSPVTLERFGAVSEEMVIEMAEGLRERSGCDVVISVSGIAGPGGGSKEKPVGTIWICVVTPKTRKTLKILFNKNRGLNKAFASQMALNLLRKML
jgi:nicotinamide-nucleotide amidase